MVRKGIAILFMASILVGCAGIGIKGSRRAEKIESYVEKISGTLVEFEMIWIPGGSCEISDPSSPRGKRRMSFKGFWLGKTEVRWDEYDVFTYGLDIMSRIKEGEEIEEEEDAISRPSRPYGNPDRGFGHEGYPAIGMTYYAAEQFCQWLSKKTGRRYRLPTEAEWEYACRCGVLPPGPIKDRKFLERIAWFKDNSEERTHPVGTKEPNPWGLYDMLGNVAEWCTGMDGRPVARGGSYKDPAQDVHPAGRQYQTPEWNASDPQFPKSKWWLSDAPFVGFRLLCEGK